METPVLQRMLFHFGKKTIRKHHSQGFEKFTVSKYYDAEDRSFLKTFKMMLRNDVPTQENIFKNHVLYKLKKD